MKKSFLILCLLLNSLVAQAHRFNLNMAYNEGIGYGYKNCSPAQEKEIFTAEKGAAIRLNKIIRNWSLASLAEVRHDYVIKEKRVWKNSNPSHMMYLSYWQEMGEPFEEMRDKFHEVTFECKTSRERRCQNNEVFAYVLFYFNYAKPVIHICPAFYGKSQESQVGTLLHELSHYSSSTEDLALEWLNGSQVDLRKASKDAYHIENFANEDISQVLKRMVWNSIWPKSRKR